MSETRRDDPILGLPTPLVFAHRGGALERPESTERAFRYAQDEVGANVLELDVQVTKSDEEFVVWHGPDLDNVLIEGRPTHPNDRSKEENDITDYSWEELRNRAWITQRREEPFDLAGIERSDDTRLLRLEDFLKRFPDVPLNIEMKGDSFRRDHIPALVRLLEEHRGDRPIVVASQSDSLLDRFRRTSEESFPTSLSIREAALAAFLGILPLFKSKDLQNRAFQSSHASHLTPENLIEEVKSAGGAVHVFLNRTWHLAGALDEDEDSPTRREIFELLDRGVDGIMTDRPGRVRPLVDAWIAERG